MRVHRRFACCVCQEDIKNEVMAQSSGQKNGLEFLDFLAFLPLFIDMQVRLSMAKACA